MHLILSLLPNLLKTAQEHHDARVVCQSSELHAMSPSDVKFESLEEINKDIGPSYLYNRSKLAQILFIRGLIQRLNDGRVGDGKNIGLANLFCNATNPGAVSTGQQDQLEEAYGTVGKIAVAMGRPFMKDSITDGCLPALYAATAEEIKTENITGQYVSSVLIRNEDNNRKSLLAMFRLLPRIRLRILRNRHRTKRLEIICGSLVKCF